MTDNTEATAWNGVLAGGQSTPNTPSERFLDIMSKPETWASGAINAAYGVGGYYLGKRNARREVKS